MDIATDADTRPQTIPASPSEDRSATTGPTPHRPMVFAAALSTIFMAAIEGTIVATAMPRIVGHQTLHIIQAYRGNPIDAAAGLFCVLLVLAMCTSLGRRMLLRPFTYLARPALHFEPYERSAGWFGTMDNQRYRVSPTATWKVTNTSKRSVVLNDFYMKCLATEHHILSVDGSQDALIPPRCRINLEVFCMVRKTLTWGSGTFTADVSIFFATVEATLHIPKEVGGRWNACTPRSPGTQEPSECFRSGYKLFSELTLVH
jgi:hypothetical protein